jgi:hypothetical protein
MPRVPGIIYVFGHRIRHRFSMPIKDARQPQKDERIDGEAAVCKVKPGFRLPEIRFGLKKRCSIPK